MKRLFIFDFDGTLFDSVWDVVDCFNDALTIEGFPTLTHEEYIVRLGGNIDEIVSLILKDKNTSENVEKVKGTYEKLYANSPKDKTKPFDGVKETLEKLQDKGVMIAINSNRKNDSVKHFVDKYLSNIDFFQIEGYDSDSPSKPNPYAVNKIKKHADVICDEMVYIGDSKTDVLTAKNAGIDCILVNWGYGHGNVFDDDYVLEVIGDISDILRYA